MGDRIQSDMGDGVRNANIGKDNMQSVVNNYINPDNRAGLSVDQRIDRLETVNNKTQDSLRRVLALMDGDTSWRIVGFSDQLAAYVKSNESWKKATEARIIENEEAIKALKIGKQIILSPGAAILTAVCVIIAIAIIYFIVASFGGV